MQGSPQGVPLKPNCWVISGARAIATCAGATKLLSKVVLAIYPPMSRTYEFLFLHILASIWCYQTHQRLSGDGYEMVYHYGFILLLPGYWSNEHLLMLLSTIWGSSLVNCMFVGSLFLSLVHFSIGLFSFQLVRLLHCRHQDAIKTFSCAF